MPTYVKTSLVTLVLISCNSRATKVESATVLEPSNHPPSTGSPSAPDAAVGSEPTVTDALDARAPSAAVDLGKPIVVVAGASIASIAIGMKRSDVLRLKIPLAPEGVERVDRKGYVAGPLLVLFDPSDTVTLVSIDLAKSAGVVIDGHVVAARATLDDFAKLPRARRSTGSGGGIVDIAAPAGRVVHVYGSFGSRTEEVHVVLDGALP